MKYLNSGYDKGSQPKKSTGLCNFQLDLRISCLGINFDLFIENKINLYGKGR